MAPVEEVANSSQQEIWFSYSLGRSWEKMLMLMLMMLMEFKEFRNQSLLRVLLSGLISIRNTSPK